jgi:hypothetical protein
VHWTLEAVVRRRILRVVRIQSFAGSQRVGLFEVKLNKTRFWHTYFIFDLLFAYQPCKTPNFTLHNRCVYLGNAILAHMITVPSHSPIPRYPRQDGNKISFRFISFDKI